MVETAGPATAPTEAGTVAGLLPFYLRGEAYLQKQSHTEAGHQFERILKLRGVDPMSPIVALAHLGLARARAGAGDADGGSGEASWTVLGLTLAALSMSVMADAIRALRLAGSDIIVDDIGFFAEPIFQPGVIDEAITDVVDDGAIYLSAAGNSADNAYENPATFTRIGRTRYVDFRPGEGVDTNLRITGGGQVRLCRRLILRAECRAPAVRLPAGLVRRSAAREAHLEHIGPGLDQRPHALFELLCHRGPDARGGGRELRALDVVGRDLRERRRSRIVDLEVRVLVDLEVAAR